MKEVKGSLSFEELYSALTENQIRNWIEKKLANYLWKIKGRNSYGSRKKLETILKELQTILIDFKIYIRKKKK